MNRVYELEGEVEILKRLLLKKEEVVNKLFLQLNREKARADALADLVKGGLPIGWEHPPAPWRYDPGRDVVWDADMGLVLGGAKLPGDAILIVRAVNSYTLGRKP